MTEITDNRKPLPIAIDRFVLHWGEMGGQWGVNRSVSQIHALLFLSEKPMTAEDIADTLGLARSNVSNSIKELLAWNLIRRVPIRGDRRDHFEAETDIWEVFLRVAAGRKEREIDPARAAERHARLHRDDGALLHPDAERAEAADRERHQARRARAELSARGEKETSLEVGHGSAGRRASSASLPRERG